MVYLLISLPDILGFGYVIDWGPGATLFQKVKGYVVSGLSENFVWKCILAVVIGLCVSIMIGLKKRSSL